MLPTSMSVSTACWSCTIAPAEHTLTHSMHSLHRLQDRQRCASSIACSRLNPRSISDKVSHPCCDLRLRHRDAAPHRARPAWDCGARGTAIRFRSSAILRSVGSSDAGSAADKRIDRFRRFVSLGDRFDNGRRTQRRIASGENAFDAGGKSVLVRKNPSAGTQLHAEPGRVRRTPDSHEDRVGLDGRNLGIVKQGIVSLESPVIVEHAGAGAKCRVGNPFAFGLYSGRAQTVADIDSFFDSLGDPFRMSRHFARPLHAGKAHGLHARQSQRSARGIQRKIGTAEHQDIGTDFGSVAGIRLAKEIQSVQHTLRILAGNSQLAIHPGTGGDKNRMKPFRDGAEFPFDCTSDWRRSFGAATVVPVLTSTPRLTIA